MNSKDIYTRRRDREREKERERKREREGLETTNKDQLAWQASSIHVTVMLQVLG